MITKKIVADVKEVKKDVKGVKEDKEDLKMEGTELVGDKLKSKMDKEKKKVGKDDKSVAKAVKINKAPKAVKIKAQKEILKQEPKQANKPDLLLKRKLKSKLSSKIKPPRHLVAPFNLQAAQSHMNRILNHSKLAGKTLSPELQHLTSKFSQTAKTKIHKVDLHIVNFLQTLEQQTLTQESALLVKIFKKVNIDSQTEVHNLAGFMIKFLKSLNKDTNLAKINLTKSLNTSLAHQVISWHNFYTKKLD